MSCAKNRLALNRFQKNKFLLPVVCKMTDKCIMVQTINYAKTFKIHCSGFYPPLRLHYFIFQDTTFKKNRKNISGDKCKKSYPKNSGSYFIGRK